LPDGQGDVAGLRAGQRLLDVLGRRKDLARLEQTREPTRGRIADGVGFRIPKGYVYFALAFSIAVEALNGWVRGRGSAGRG